MKGGTRRFEHVVVDEAQDLSPMQLRMLARRARRHSMTVLGDLAQATGPASPGELGRDARAPRAARERAAGRAHDGLPAPGRVSSRWRTACSRVAAPGVAPSRSVRADGDPPDLHRVAPDELVEQVAEHALALVEEFATVAVIATPTSASTSCGAAIEDRGVVLAEPGEVDPDRPLVVVPAPAREGPRVRRRDRRRAGGDRRPSGPHGVRLLFVALTRAVQHLAIAHASELPSELVRPRRRPRRVGSRAMSETIPRLRITPAFGQRPRRAVAGRDAPRRGRHDQARRRRRDPHPADRGELDARGRVPGRDRCHDQHRRRATSTCAATPAR